MNELALSAGSGAGQLASQWLVGFQTVCYVEWNEYRIEILKARIRDGLLDDAPIWGDARTFDGGPWRGRVHLVSAGFPCQPFALGGKRLGGDDSRNLWPDIVRIIGEVAPQWVFLENSTRLLSPFRGIGEPAYFGTILGDLAEIGYDAKWGCLSAAGLGAFHKRERLWIVAYPRGQGREIVLRGEARGRVEQGQRPVGRRDDQPASSNSLDAILGTIARLEARLGEPSIFRTNDGFSNRVDQLAACGDGQVPVVAEAAWRILTDEIIDTREEM